MSEALISLSHWTRNFFCVFWAVQSENRLVQPGLGLKRMSLSSVVSDFLVKGREPVELSDQLFPPVDINGIRRTCRQTSGAEDGAANLPNLTETISAAEGAILAELQERNSFTSTLTIGSKQRTGKGARWHTNGNSMRSKMRRKRG